MLQMPTHPGVNSVQVIPPELLQPPQKERVQFPAVQHLDVHPRAARFAPLLDVDPQASLTVGWGVDVSQLETTMYDVVVEGAALAPANIYLSAAELRLASEYRREDRIRQALEGLVQPYDYILMDCPPSLGLLTINAFSAVDSVLIPMSCDYYAMVGVRLLLDSIARTRAQIRRFMANKRASVKNNSPLDAMFQPSAPADEPAAKTSGKSAAAQSSPTRQTSLFLTEEQTAWLDLATMQAKQGGGKAISKAVIIRTLVEIAMQTPLDFTGVQSEEEVRERIEAALASL
jgi:hypothetical protein